MKNLQPKKQNMAKCIEANTQLHKIILVFLFGQITSKRTTHESFLIHFGKSILLLVCLSLILSRNGSTHLRMAYTLRSYSSKSLKLQMSLLLVLSINHHHSEPLQSSETKTLVLVCFYYFLGSRFQSVCNFFTVYRPWCYIIGSIWSCSDHNHISRSQI